MKFYKKLAIICVFLFIFSITKTEAFSSRLSDFAKHYNGDRNEFDFTWMEDWNKDGKKDAEDIRFLWKQVPKKSLGDYTLDGKKDWYDWFYLKSRSIDYDLKDGKTPTLIITLDYDFDGNLNNELKALEKYSKNIPHIAYDFTNDGLVNEADLNILIKGISEYNQEYSKSVIWARIKKMDVSLDGSLSSELKYLQELVGKQKTNPNTKPKGIFDFEDTPSKGPFKTDLNKDGLFDFNDIETLILGLNFKVHNSESAGSIQSTKDSVFDQNKFDPKLDVNNDGVLNAKDVRDLRAQLPSNESPYALTDISLMTLLRTESFSYDKPFYNQSYYMQWDVDLDGELTIEDMNSIKRSRFFWSDNVELGSIGIIHPANKVAYAKQVMLDKNIGFDMNFDKVIDQKDYNIWYEKWRKREEEKDKIASMPQVIKVLEPVEEQVFLMEKDKDLELNIKWTELRYGSSPRLKVFNSKTKEEVPVDDSGPNFVRDPLKLDQVVQKTIYIRWYDVAKLEPGKYRVEVCHYGNYVAGSSWVPDSCDSTFVKFVNSTSIPNTLTPSNSGPQTIRVTYPKGGENINIRDVGNFPVLWRQGKEMSAHWNGSIELLNEKNKVVATSTMIFAEYDPVEKKANMKFNLNDEIQATLPQKYKVRICDNSNEKKPVCGISDDWFTLRRSKEDIVEGVAQVIKITEPTAGQVILIDKNVPYQELTVKWTEKKLPEQIKINLLNSKKELVGITDDKILSPSGDPLKINYSRQKTIKFDRSVVMPGKYTLQVCETGNFAVFDPKIHVCDSVVIEFTNFIKENKPVTPTTPVATPPTTPVKPPVPPVSTTPTTPVKPPTTPPAPNVRPNPPVITGPTQGVVGTLYTFKLKTVDPEGNTLNHAIDWNGDGKTDQWLPVVNSGIEQSVGRTWTATGTVTIKVAAMDQNKAVSTWTTHVIQILPKTISLSNQSYSLASNNTLFESPNLELGMVHPAVITLQQYLNSNGYIVNDIAGEPGSIGYEADYFGQKTKQALIKFQQDKEISPAQGYFGPKTREVMGN